MTKNDVKSGAKTKAKNEEVKKMLGIASRRQVSGFTALKDRNATFLNVKKMEEQWKKWESRSNELHSK